MVQSELDQVEKSPKPQQHSRNWYCYLQLRSSNMHLQHQIATLNHLEPSPNLRHLTHALLHRPTRPRSQSHTTSTHYRILLLPTKEPLLKDWPLDYPVIGLPLLRHPHPHRHQLSVNQCQHPLELLSGAYGVEKFTVTCTDFEKSCALEVSFCLDF